MSDSLRRKVFTLTLDGSVEQVTEVPAKPSGIGFLPDKTPLIVSMEDRRLLRLEGEQLVCHAELAPLVTGELNDMVVDQQGRAYVGNFGFDILADADFQPASLVMVTPRGEARVVAEDLAFPNGTVILTDEAILVVAETLGNRLTAFDVAADGGLSNRRIYADLGEHEPDGICLDVNGGIWVSSFERDVFLRVLQGGAITDWVDVAGRRAVACQLGGSDGCTLFCLTCENEWEEVRVGNSRARIEVTKVDVAGAGSP